VGEIMVEKLFIIKRRYMNINVKHPSFVSFLETIINNVLSNVPVDSYFNLTQDKKTSTQYLVFKLLRNTVKVKSKLTDNELKSFLPILINKSEEFENYELSAVLNDISNNFDSISEFTKPTQKRIVKTDKTIKKDNVK
jgi:hypothetical protein